MALRSEERTYVLHYRNGIFRVSSRDLGGAAGGRLGGLHRRWRWALLLLLPVRAGGDDDARYLYHDRKTKTELIFFHFGEPGGRRGATVSTPHGVRSRVTAPGILTGDG